MLHDDSRVGHKGPEVVRSQTGISLQMGKEGRRIGVIIRVFTSALVTEASSKHQPTVFLLYPKQLLPGSFGISISSPATTHSGTGGPRAIAESGADAAETVQRGPISRSKWRQESVLGSQMVGI